MQITSQFNHEFLFYYQITRNELIERPFFKNKRIELVKHDFLNKNV